MNIKKALLTAGLAAALACAPFGLQASHATEPSKPLNPQVQDYITCDGGAFVLDNSSSTEPVEYVVNGTTYSVPAGGGIHTDADGAPLIQSEGGYTITAGGRTWTFPVPADCAPTPEPSPEPTVPTPEPEPTPEVTAPPEPAVTEPPSPQPEPVVESPTVSQPSTEPEPDHTPVPVIHAEGPDALAFTGTEEWKAGLWWASGLMGAGALLLVLTTLARRGKANG